MSQRTAFAAIPNTQPLAYPATLVLLFGEIRRAKPTPKALREFLRMRNLFDKDGLPVLAELIDVALTDPVAAGPFAAKVLECDDDAAIRQAIAGRLVDQNPLLAKYCLEALDAEHGGRLNSTNELYRMITSYVYPGDKPTLGAFKAWVDWAVAAELLKLVGIRWALGATGKDWLPRLRAIDTEEFLEEEREALGTAAGTAAEADEDAPPAAAPAEAEPCRAASSDAAGPAMDAAPAATAPVPAAAEAPVAAPAPAPAIPRRPPAPSPVDRPPIAGRAPLGADLDATRDLLVAWYAGTPVRRPSWTVEAGLDPSRRAGAALYEASFAALLAARGLDGAAIAATLSTLRDTGVLLAAGKGKLPVDAVAAALARSPTPALAAGCESVVHLPRLLAGTGDPDLLRAETPRDLLTGLWRRLYEPLFPLGPFLLARFLGEAGSIPEALRPAGLVPAFAVREAAFRIGFLDRLYAGSFEDLVDASQGLASRFGPPDFEGPLARAAEGFGCAFCCPRAPACPLACREKGEIAR